MKNKSVFVVLFVMLALFLTISSALAEDVPTIKIGVIYALTGPSAATGVDQKSALELGVDIVNNSYPDINLPFAATEGIPSKNGAKIELIFANSEGDPEKGASEAERLIQQEGVVMLMGSYQSSVVATASQVAERAKVPFFVVESSSPSLTSRGFKYIFRQGAHDAMIAKTTFDFIDSIRKEKGINSLAFIYENTIFGTDTANSWQKLADERGYKVVESLAYPANTTNMNSEVQRLMNAKPDLVMASSYVSDAVLMMNTFKQMNYMPNLLANAVGFTESTFFNMLGKDAEYIISRMLYCSDYAKINENAAKIEKLFTERTGIPHMNDNTVRAVQAAFVVADVLERSKSLNPTDIRDAFATTNIPAKDLIVPWKSISFDENGQNQNATAVIAQVQNGAYATVWPHEFATADLIFPLPGWDER